MKLSVPLLFLLVTACGASTSSPTVTNVGPATAGSGESAPVAADDCEIGSIAATSPHGVQAIERPEGSGRWFWADRTGKVLATAFLFDNGPDYWSEGFVRIVDASGKMGFLDEHGVIIVPPQYDWVYPFCHGLARIARDGKAGYIDRRGAPAVGPADDDRPLIPAPHVD